MTRPPTRVGIIGCGMVADEYVTTLAACDHIHLRACADLDPTRSANFSQRHGLLAMEPTALMDPHVTDLAVILTPPETHATLTRQAIAAQLPAVWVEKPLALTAADADELLSAAASAGTCLGVAPDTVLGPALRTATQVLQGGLIGAPLSATATLFSTGPERWHSKPEPFYAAGAGPLGDMGPYYLTALDQLLGPLDVYAATTRTRPSRRIRSGPRAGAAFSATAPTYVAALMQTENQTPVTFISSFDAAGTRAPHIEIHGTDGTLVLPDPNFHHGDVLLRPYGELAWQVVGPVSVPAPVGRGMGVAELATCLRTTGATCDAARAARVVRLTAAILHAATVSSTPIATAAQLPHPAHVPSPTAR